MRYLRDSDYKYKITEHDLGTLVEDEVNPELFIFDAEIKAQEQISLFLRKRYDLMELFKTYPDHKTGMTYTTGDTVWYSISNNPDWSFDAFLYNPLYPTNSLPTTNNWQTVEPRHPIILDWMVAISLYKLHERLSPDNIPTHRKDAYDEVMKLLRMVQDERLSPDFPEISDRSYNIYITGKEDSGIGFYY